MTEAKLPPGWQASAWPSGWNFDEDRDNSCQNMERVGYVLLPAVFHVALQFPELPRGDSEYASAVLMTFEVVDNDLVLRELRGCGVDISAWLGYLVQHFPPEEWKPLAVWEMAQFLAFEEKRRARPAVPDAAFTRAYDQVRGVRPRSGGKRYRITSEHLAGVAGTYEKAVESGEPPTQAVADHYQVAHSTAAKWVGAARRQSHLPPASEMHGAAY